MKFRPSLLFLSLLISFGFPAAVSAATYYWTGDAGASINVATNWSTTVNAACGVSTGGAVPGASDTAIFDTTCKNSAAIDASWTITALDMQSGYTGTLTQTAGLTLSGTLTVTAGTLAIADQTASAGTVILTGGTISGTTGVLTGTSYDMRSGTISAILGGTGVVLTKTTAGTVTLSGANTYTGLTTLTLGTLTLSGDNTALTGGVTLTAGTLNINSATALGTGTFTINGGTIMNNSAGAVTLTTNNVQAWNANFSTSLTNSLNLGTGTVTLGADVTISSPSATLTVGGIISGAHSLAKSGTGSLTLSGANDFTGSLTINASGGQVTLSGANTFGGIGQSITMGTGSVLNLQNAQALGSSSNTLIINGGIITNAATLTLSTNNPQTWNGSFVGNIVGTLNLGTGAVTLGADVQVLVSTGILSIGGIVSGSYSLTKAGATTLILGGANDFSGSTTISTGTIQLNNALALQNSAVTVSATNGLKFGPSIGTFTISGLAGASNFALTDTGSVAVTLQAGGNNANTTYSGVMSGTGGAFTKQGSGTLILSGANTQTGSTTISAGILQLNNALALQNSTVTVSATNGLIFGPSIGTFTIGGLAGASNFALTDTGSVAVTLQAGQNNADTTYSGVMSGTGGITKQGSGVLILSGANTYTGTTTISGGTLLFHDLAGADPDAILPQRRQDEVDLYAWLKTLTESDFDVPQTAGTAITYSPAGATVRDLYGFYYGIQNSRPQPHLLRYPSSAFVLDNGAGEGIEGDGVNVRILRNATSETYGPNIEGSILYSLTLTGMSNPFYHHAGLANRLVSQAVATMMEISEQANYGTYGSYPEYVGMIFAQSMAAFEAAKGGATGMTPELRQSFYNTANLVVNAWDNHAGPNDVNTNMDTETFCGLSLLYKGATEEGLTDIATNARELSAKYLLGSRTATDAGAALGKQHRVIFHPAGYIGELNQPDPSYAGISIYNITKAALIVDGVAGWEWLWDTNGIVDRMAKFKSYQIFRDPDGRFNGPSGYAQREGYPYAMDQSSSIGRDLMVAQLSDYGKESFYKRSWGMNYTLWDPPTTNLTLFNTPSLSTVESSIQTNLNSTYGTNAFTLISPLYKSITQASIPWWAVRVGLIAWEYYNPTLYDTLSSLISSDSSTLQLPSLRTGQQYSVPFGRTGEQPEFWTLKNDDGAGTEFAAFIESFTNADLNGYDSWRGGGTVQSFWTSDAGLVINSRLGKHSYDSAAWPAVETWATHHLWGTLADDTAFSSAQRDTRVSSYTYDSITNPTQVVATNTPDRASGSYTGTVQYQRTIAKITNGLQITTGLTTNSQDQIKTLWESLPIYISYDKTTNASTTIEYWNGTAWTTMPAAETVATTTKVRLGRNHGSGPAYAYLGFPSVQKIKLAPEWQGDGQADDYYQQLMIDLHPDSGTAQTITNASLTYTIQTTEPTTSSSDATLSNLAISSGTLTPAFASGTTAYTDSVANDVTSVTVTPTVNQANATVTVNGTAVTSGSASGAISLSVGSNTITTIVTAQDEQTTSTYTITVTRAAATVTVSAGGSSGGGATLPPVVTASTTASTSTLILLGSLSPGKLMAISPSPLTISGRVSLLLSVTLRGKRILLSNDPQFQLRSTTTVATTILPWTLCTKCTLAIYQVYLAELDIRNRIIASTSAAVIYLPPELAKLLAGKTAVKATAKAPVKTSTVTRLTRDLYFGLSGPDVTFLQNFLIKQGYLAPDLATGYFGSATKAAVIKFQSANGITPLGGVGAGTRGAIENKQ